jgi:hypothetical protein
MRGELDGGRERQGKVSEALAKELAGNASILSPPEFAWSALPMHADGREHSGRRTLVLGVFLAGFGRITLFVNLAVRANWSGPFGSGSL